MTSSLLSREFGFDNNTPLNYPQKDGIQAGMEIIFDFILQVLSYLLAKKILIICFKISSKQILQPATVTFVYHHRVCLSIDYHCLIP